MISALLLTLGLSGYVYALPQQHWAVSGRDREQRPQDPECKSDTYNTHDQDVGYGTGIGVQCCDEWGVGNRGSGCENSGSRIGVDGSNSFTYSEAVDYCASNDMRLCTREEVDNGAGEGTGCSMDDNLVWTSTRCYGRHWVVDGTKLSGGVANDECLMDVANQHSQIQNSAIGYDIGVQCCDEEGTRSRPDCQQKKTYDEAYGLCQSKGLRLCTLFEANIQQASGVGCGFDSTMVWTSTECAIKDENESSQCAALDIDRFLSSCSTEFETSNLQISSLKISVMNLHNSVDDLDSAKSVLDGKVAALESKDGEIEAELNAEVTALKQSDSDMTTSISLLRADFSHLIRSHWALDGYPGVSDDYEPECMLDSIDTSENDKGIGYHCCDEDGNGSRDGCADFTAYSYNEAVAKCEAANKKLCTREQVEAQHSISNGQGNPTGCHMHGTLVWTSTPCNEYMVRDEIVDLVDGKVEQLEQKDEDIYDKIDDLGTTLDEKVTDVSDKVDNKVSALNSEIATLKNRIKTLEDHSDSLKGSSAHVGFAANAIEEPTGALSTVSADTLIICLVIFNIGTILGCISCLFWKKRAANGKGSIYDDVQQYDDEEKLVN